MYLILSSILFPILAGLFLLVRYRTPLSGEKPVDRQSLTAMAGCSLIITAIFVIAALFAEKGFTLFYLAQSLPIYFRVDSVGRIFSLLAVIVIPCAGFFSFEYMKHEEHESRYYGFYLLVFGVFNALCFAGNLITFYLFFELLTMSSMPLVLHNGSKEAVMAGLKYLFYSLCGAYAALFGIYHMSLIKLIPTGLLGLVFCYVAYRTDSIYPAMLMHFLNNAFSVIISCCPEQVRRIFPIFYQDTLRFGDVLLLLGIGLALMGIGLYILKKGSRRGRKEEKADF